MDKDNFLDTVKQKSDKELEIISRDYSFYSEADRVIALNELESRNGLSEELSNLKKTIDPSAGMPAITEQALKAVKSAKRIYTDNMVWVATYLGGPLVAGYLIAENFKTFNEAGKVTKTWIITIIGTILIFGGIYMIPDSVNIPNILFPVIYASIAYGVVKHYQAKNISAYVALGGKPFSWGRAILVSVIGVIITLAAIFVVIFSLPAEAF